MDAIPYCLPMLPTKYPRSCRLSSVVVCHNKCRTHKKTEKTCHSILPDHVPQRISYRWEQQRIRRCVWSLSLSCALFANIFAELSVKLFATGPHNARSDISVVHANAARPFPLATGTCFLAALRVHRYRLWPLAHSTCTPANCPFEISRWYRRNSTGTEGYYKVPVFGYKLWICE